MLEFIECAFKFLDSTFLQTSAVIGTGAAAYDIYLKQQDENVRTAATLLKLEIKSIENNLKAIKSNVAQLPLTSNHLDVTILKSHPIYQNLSWFEYRGILAPLLESDDVEKINEFYEQIIKLEMVRTSYREFSLKNQESKLKAIHDSSIYYLAEKLKNNEKSNMIDIKNYFDIFGERANGDTPVFYPHTARGYFEVVLNESDDKFTHSSIYNDKLKKLTAYKRKFPQYKASNK